MAKKQKNDKQKLLRDARGDQELVGGRDQEGLPSPGPQVASRQESGQSEGGREALQGDLRGLRGPLRE